MKEFKWKPPYISLEVAPVTILPPSPEMIREKVRNIERLKHWNDLHRALNIPANSGIQKTGPLTPNDDWNLNERHFYNVTKGMEL